MKFMHNLLVEQRFSKYLKGFGSWRGGGQLKIRPDMHSKATLIKICNYPLKKHLRSIRGYRYRESWISEYDYCFPRKGFPVSSSASKSASNRIQYILLSAVDVMIIIITIISSYC